MSDFIFKYSIIIPHKNSPELLLRCLNSIPDRKDVQIIIVDDNSDNVDFCNFPGKNRLNVETYFTKDGKGAGYARNVGLNHARGKWLLFADADDFYSKDFLTELDKYVNSNYDIIYFSIYSLNSETLQPSNRDANINYFFSKYKEDDIKSADYVRFKRWGPWNKMISYTFWKKHNVYFQELPFGNDMFFITILGALTNNFKLIDKKLYCLTFLDSSISYKHRDYKLEILSFKLYAQICELYDIIGRNKWKLIKFYYFYTLYKKVGFSYFCGYLWFCLRNILKIRKLIKEGKEIVDLTISNNIKK